MQTNDSKVVHIVNRYEKLFKWVRIFYPKAKGVPIQYLLYCFVPQKILMINGQVPWPVHFTSRILYPKRVTVGECCAPGLAGSCYIQARNGILIGDNLWTGPGVGLISSNHDLNDYRHHINTKPLAIGNNVWIGMNAVLLPGITIGNNVAIGANAVVTKDLPDNAIAAGNPCRVLKEKPPYQGKTTTR
jgi:acetyltransferase-like isoleucine patch superfamily enzyme